MPDDMTLADYGTKVRECLADAFRILDGRELEFFAFSDGPEDPEYSEDIEEGEAV